MTLDDYERVPPETVVFRLVSINRLEFVPPDTARELPLPAAFEPSDDDKKDSVPLLTVWDRGRTSIQQAKMIRNCDREPAKAFALHAHDVETKVVFHDGSNPLRVVRDPLDLPKAGANGHCGISGLVKKPGEEKKWYKDLKRQLRDLCWPLSDSGPAEPSDTLSVDTNHTEKPRNP